MYHRHVISSLPPDNIVAPFQSESESVKLNIFIGIVTIAALPATLL